MNGFSEASLFAVVLAVNLFLLGAVLAGGLTLAFRFLENVAPRLRYSIAVAVFLLAVLLPVAATLKTSSAPKTLPNATSQKSAQSGTGEDFAELNDAFLSRDVANLAEAPEVKSNGFIYEFISTAADSAFGKFFVGLWMAGICLLILREILGVQRMRNARKLWQPATESEKQSLLCENKTRLYFAEDQSPGTVGLLRPVIVLPEQFSRALPLDSRRLIVRHELSHARWRDPLASLLLRVVRAVFWVSPAIWLLERLIDSEREAAADRAAILSLRHRAELKTIALDYADTLLLAAEEFNSFELRQQNRKLPLIGIGGAGTSELETRIRRLLSSAQTTRMPIFSAIVAALLTSIAASVMPLAAFSDKLQAQQNQTAAANLPDEENINRVSFSEQSGQLSQKSVSGDENSFKQSASVTTALSKTGKIGKMPTSGVINSGAVRQISKENQNTNESLNNDVTRVGDSSVLTETLSDVDIGRADDRLNQNPPPPARSLKEAETLTITGNQGNNPARASDLTGNLPSLNKLRTDLTSEDELVRQKAASELDRLSSSGNTLESARQLNRIPTRTRNLTTPAWRIQ